MTTIIRLSKTDRRDSIIEAAMTVFARHGFVGAKTQDIAKASKVSEALVFRHFPSKVAIYRAVLRKIIRAQDEAFRQIAVFTPDAAGLVSMLRLTFAHSLRGKAADNAEGTRIYFSSLAGDGSYAALSYRRATRLWGPYLEAAMIGARAAGDLQGPPLAPLNALAFIEHTASMMLISRSHDHGAARYDGDDSVVLADAVYFCARGLGLTDAAIAANLDIRKAEKPSQGRKKQPAGKPTSASDLTASKPRQPAAKRSRSA